MRHQVFCRYGKGFLSKKSPAPKQLEKSKELGSRCWLALALGVAAFFPECLDLREAAVFEPGSGSKRSLVSRPVGVLEYLILCDFHELSSLRHPWSLLPTHKTLTAPFPSPFISGTLCNFFLSPPTHWGLCAPYSLQNLCLFSLS